VRKTTDPREEKKQKKTGGELNFTSFIKFLHGWWFHPAPTHTSIRIDHPHVDQELSHHLPT
jgi:hypothetical protein